MKKLNLLFIGILLISIVSCNKDESVSSSAPIVNSKTTNANAEITFTTVKITGKVASNGSAEVTSRGVCWSKNPNPTINDNAINSDNNNISQTIINLTVNTAYFFRIFAINNFGISYGENQSFKTLNFDNSTWEFKTLYMPDNFTLHSKIDFYSNGTTKFDELDLPNHCPGCFITYGSWSLDGNTLTYIWEGNNPVNSNYVYIGIISGMTMIGTYNWTPAGTWSANILN